MRCIRIPRASRHVACVATMLALSVGVSKANGQQPYPPPGYPVYPQPYPPQQYPYPQPIPTGAPAGVPATLPAYRRPVISVAAPTEGTAVPEDKPVAVLRFMSGEPLDPIDALSFSITVDGKDRRSLFQLTEGEAWGRLADPSEVLAAGQHEVAARICTSRGECGTTKATITVVAESASIQLASTAAKAVKKKTKIFDAVLQAARVLIR
ncbi:MAG: hypothetical protein ACR2NS_06410 [Gemmatimonadaceae bacterium]